MLPVNCAFIFSFPSLPSLLLFVCLSSCWVGKQLLANCPSIRHKILFRLEQIYSRKLTVSFSSFYSSNHDMKLIRKCSILAKFQLPQVIFLLSVTSKFPTHFDLLSPSFLWTPNHHHHHPTPRLQTLIFLPLPHLPELSVEKCAQKGVNIPLHHFSCNLNKSHHHFLHQRVISRIFCEWLGPGRDLTMSSNDSCFCSISRTVVKFKSTVVN